MLRYLPFFSLLCLLMLGGPAVTQEPAFKIVVNSSNPVSSLTKARLSQLFLKEIRECDHGQSVIPVQLGHDSSVRASFSEFIHGRDLAAIQSYWSRMVFSGRALPPSEKTNDQEILAFVRANPGAVGYVSEETPVGEGLRVIEIVDEGRQSG